MTGTREHKRAQYFEDLLTSMEMLIDSLQESRKQGAFYMADEFQKRFASTVQRLERELRQVHIKRPGFQHKVLFCSRALSPAHMPNRITVHQIGCPRAPKDGQASGPYGWRVIEVIESSAPKMISALYMREDDAKLSCRSCGGLKRA